MSAPTPSPEALSVLLLEDNPADARLVREALAGGFSLDWVRTLPEAEARLDRGGADVVLTDLNVPGSRGLETFRALRARRARIPIVVLTGLGDDPAAAQAVAEGAQDFLSKAELSGTLLARVLRFAFERARLERFKDEFLQNVGHELRTPVTVTYAALKRALDLDAGGCGSEQRRCLEMALRNTNRFMGLVEDLADCTRAREGTFAMAPRRTALAGLLRETAEELRAAGESARVRVSAGPFSPLRDAYADPKRVRQVLVNLVGNAVKFTPAGGSVRLTAAEDPADPKRLRLAVSDTGPGLAPDALSRVFDRLYQGPDEHEGRRGLGLGLYISRQLVALSGGRLWAESAPGRGSTFFFTLPVFALEDWLAPLAASSGPLVLFSVELWPSGEDLAPHSASGRLREAGAALSAALPEAVLLPEQAPPGAEGLLFLAARSPKPFKRDMLRRAASALAGCRSLADAGALPVLGCSVVALPAAMSREGFLAAAARALTAAVAAALERRSVRLASLERGHRSRGQEAPRRFSR